MKKKGHRSLEQTELKLTIRNSAFAKSENWETKYATWSAIFCRVTSITKIATLSFDKLCCQ